MYNDKYIKTKTNLCNNKTNTNFHDNKIPEEGVRCVCLSVILLDSIVKVGKRYYPKSLLKKCKYAVKNIKNVIGEELDLDESDDEHDQSNESDEENNVH